MAKKPYTTNSQIKSVLRKWLWLRSRERARRLKMDDYTCQICGKKQSMAKGRVVKVEVDHIEGVLNWLEIYAVIRKYLLVDPDKLRTLCKECHKEVTKHGPRASQSHDTKR